MAKPLDRDALHAAALAHVERYACSAEQLRRALRRKIRRAQVEGLDEVADEIVDRFVASRLVDDAVFARQRAGTLARRGDSARLIAEKLRAKGVGAADARSALTELVDGDEAALELSSAQRYAERRRIGPHRKDPEARAANRDRDLAALCRRGFSYEIALRVISVDLSRPEP